MLFDRFGTWVSRSVASVFCTLGFTILALSSPKSSWLLLPGMVLISFSGYHLAVTNMPLGVLFPNWRSFCITLMMGSFQTSAAVTSVVKLTYDHGWTLYHIFMGFIIASSFIWARTFFLMPHHHVVHSTSNPYRAPVYKLLRMNKSKKSSEESHMKNNDANSLRLIDSKENTSKKTGH